MRLLMSKSTTKSGEARGERCCLTRQETLTVTTNAVSASTIRISASGGTRSATGSVFFARCPVRNIAGSMRAAAAAAQETAARAAGAVLLSVPGLLPVLWGLLSVLLILLVLSIPGLLLPGLLLPRGL